jgi:serine/threonine-protein kinase RsbW
VTAAKAIKKILSVKSDPKEVVQVELFLEKINKQLHLDDLRFNKLLVATTEAVNNSIVHGNKRNPQKIVTITLEFFNNTISVSVEDEGPGLDPSALPDPLTEENLLRENGRGVFLMRSLMDKVTFGKTSRGSIVIMSMEWK